MKQQLYKSHGSALEVSEHLMTLRDGELEVSGEVFVLGQDCLDLNHLQHFLRGKPRLLNNET